MAKKKAKKEQVKKVVKETPFDQKAYEEAERKA